MSAKILGTKQQAHVRLTDGKAYDCISRYPVAAGDSVIIGNTFAFGSSFCQTHESPNTGVFGVVESALDKAVIKKETAVELDFVFTPTAD